MKVYFVLEGNNTIDFDSEEIETMKKMQEIINSCGQFYRISSTDKEIIMNKDRILWIEGVL